MLRDSKETLKLVDQVLTLRPTPKVRKNRVFSLLMLLQDLSRGSVPLDREIGKIAQWFWRDIVDDKQEEFEPSGRVTSATTIQNHYGWFEARAAQALSLTLIVQ